MCLQRGHDFCSSTLLVVMTLVSSQRHSNKARICLAWAVRGPCAGSMCWVHGLGGVGHEAKSWCALRRQPGMRHPTTPAFKTASVLQGAAPAPPPHTAALTNLHASMASNDFLIIRHVVTLLAVKREPSRYRCNAFFPHQSGFLIRLSVLVASLLVASLLHAPSYAMVVECADRWHQLNAAWDLQLQTCCWFTCCTCQPHVCSGSPSSPTGSTHVCSCSASSPSFPFVSPITFALRPSGGQIA